MEIIALLLILCMCVFLAGSLCMLLASWREGQRADEQRAAFLAMRRDLQRRIYSDKPL